MFHSLNNTSPGYVVKTAVTVTNSKRQIPIPEFVLQELCTHKQHQEEWKGLVGELYEDNDLVICTNTGALQDPRNVVRVMKRLVKSAKVPNIRFHDIRHTMHRF